MILYLNNEPLREHYISILDRVLLQLELDPCRKFLEKKGGWVGYNYSF